MDTMTPKEKALAHYLGMVAEIKDSLNSVDFNRAAQAHRDEEELLRADPAYSAWLDKLNQQETR